MAAALVALIAAPLALLVGTQGKSAVAAALRDPMSLLSARSPGARARGALTQTKPNRLAGEGRAARAHAPHERVLSTGRTRPPVADVVAPAEAPLFTPAPPGQALVAGPGPVIGGFGGPRIPPVPVLPGTSPIGGGGGGGGGGGSGGDTDTPPKTPTTPIPPTPAVPEPATWIAMIVGFLAVGIGLRHDRSCSGAPAVPEASRRHLG